jgi:hypothetical protein
MLMLAGSRGTLLRAVLQTPMDPAQILERIHSDRPKFHRSETEIIRPFAPSESGLDREDARLYASSHALCHGINPTFARSLLDHAKPGMKTLETG